MTYVFFAAGGAQGFDTLAAQSVLALRQAYPWIKLILMLPCHNQADRWPAEAQRAYRSIMQQADKVVYTATHYTPGCMQRRNRHLMDNSGWCICFLQRQSCGTFYTVQYGRRRGVQIINLARQHHV
nr:SLOG family protein [Maliibacterium massiliense]